MVTLLKTASVQVSSIQIMQVRVQTRAKVFGKVDPTETYHTAPPSSAHVQPDDVPRTPIQPSVEGEFR